MNAILTPAQIDALSDVDYVTKCATGPVIDADDIAAQLDAGNRVYAVDRAAGAIARVQWADDDVSRFAGFYVGAGSVPVARA